MCTPHPTPISALSYWKTTELKDGPALCLRAGGTHHGAQQDDFRNTGAETFVFVFITFIIKVIFYLWQMIAVSHQ